MLTWSLFFRLFSVLLFLSSCSLFKTDSSLESGNQTKQYDFSDVSGKYLLQKKILIQKEKRKIITKTELISLKKADKILEKTLSLSQLGKVGKNKRSISRPFVSQYTVWLENKEYFVQTKLNFSESKAELLLKSPENQWNGKREISIPRDAKTYCFFSQLIECLKVIGFFKQENKEIAVKIVWDGYPYFQEQYLNLKKELFTNGYFRFESINENKNRIYQLEVDKQILLYEIDQEDNLKNFFWVSQGVTMKGRK